MARRPGYIKLGGFFHPTGNHVAAWLHPDAQADASVNIAHYIELAKTSERGRFDLIFLADHNAVREGPIAALSRAPQYMGCFEPTTLLAALAAVTTHIGLVATVTTTYNEPYNIARRFGSLDHISGGRAGWNVVTSSNKSEAFNYGREAHPARDEAYSRALEFVAACKHLWDSYDDDAFVRDRDRAVFFEPDRLHYDPFEGDHFKVRGPLNMARPPQGYPVFAQAGASEVGRDFAAKIAEIVFTPLHTLREAQAFSRDMKARAARYGRDPAEIKIMPGLNAIVGRTDEEAEETYRLLQSRIHPDVGRLLLSTELEGFDFSGFDVDAPFPLGAFPTPETLPIAGQNVVAKARADDLTIRGTYEWYAGARGQRTLRGSPTRIADEMEDWFQQDAVDGFLVQPSYLPGGLDAFVDLVVPELVRRGLFRSEYEHATLRGHLGLRRPASRYAT